MELAYTRKPTIRLIATNNAPADKVAQIGYGIEEEGIPFSLVSPDELSDPVSLAHVAATQSQLLVGIACDGRDAVLHYRNLPRDEGTMFYDVAGLMNEDGGWNGWRTMYLI